MQLLVPSISVHFSKINNKLMQLLVPSISVHFSKINNKLMQLLIVFIPYLFIYSTCFERHPLIIRSLKIIHIALPRNESI
jgi:hypothetical protein